MHPKTAELKPLSKEELLERPEGKRQLSVNQRQREHCPKINDCKSVQSLGDEEFNFNASPIPREHFELLKAQLFEQLKKQLPLELMSELKSFVTTSVNAKVAQETFNQITNFKVQVGNLVQTSVNRINSDILVLKNNWEKQFNLLCQKQVSDTQTCMSFLKDKFDQLRFLHDDLESHKSKVMFFIHAEMKSGASNLKSNLMEVQNELNSKMDILENKLWNKMLDIDKKLDSKSVSLESTNYQNPLCLPLDLTDQQENNQGQLSSRKPCPSDDSFFQDLKALDTIITPTQLKPIPKLPSKNNLFGEEMPAVTSQKQVASTPKTSSQRKFVFEKKVHPESSIITLDKQKSLVKQLNPNSFDQCFVNQSKRMPKRFPSDEYKTSVTSTSRLNEYSTNLKSEAQKSSNVVSTNLTKQNLEDSFLKLVKSLRTDKQKDDGYPLEDKQPADESDDSQEENTDKIIIDKNRKVTDNAGNPILDENGNVITVSEENVRKILDRKTTI